MSVIREEEFKGRLADLIEEYDLLSKADIGKVDKLINKLLKKRKSKPKNKDEPRHKLSYDIKEVVGRKAGNVYERLMESKLFTERKAKTLAFVLVSFPLVDRDFKEDFGIPRVPFYIFIDTFKDLVYQGPDGTVIKITACRNTFSKYYDKVWLNKEKIDNEQKRIVKGIKDEIRTQASSWF